MLTEEGYEPDWEGVNRNARGLAALGFIGGLLDSAALSWQDKQRAREDIADVRERYEAAVRALNDPNATAEERLRLAQSAIDNANWARSQLDEMSTFGARREAAEAQRVLEGIVEEMKPYAGGEGLPIGLNSNTMYWQEER